MKPVNLRVLALALMASLSVSSAHALTYNFKQAAAGLRSATCSIWGLSIAEGSTVTAYSTPTADLGGCLKETRTCSRGALTGAAAYQSCTATSTTTWDPNSKWDSYNGVLGKNVLFSNNNLSVGEGDWGQQSFAAATTAHTTGKWYFELSISNVLNGDLYLGLSDGNPSGWVARTNGLAGGAFTGNVSDNRLTSFGLSSGNIVMLAVDLDAKKIWIGTNCSWAANGDPAAGANPAALLVSPGSVKPLWGSGYTWARPNPTNLTTANFGASAFNCPVPAGFNPGW